MAIPYMNDLTNNLLALTTSINSPLFYLVIFSLIVLFADKPLGCLTPNAWLADPRRNRRVEGLRGLLAPSVMIYHSLITYYFYQHDGVWQIPPSNFYFRIGTSPVIVFFYLTGYLFFNQALENRPFKFMHFIKRRFFRLAPAFYAAFAIVLLTVLIESKGTLIEPMPALVSHIFSWLTFALPMGDFPNLNNNAQTLVIIAGVVWTLRWEWLFYISFGILRKITRLRYQLLLILGCIAVWLIYKSTPIQNFISANPFWKNGFTLLADFGKYYVAGFGVGALAAILKRKDFAINILSTKIATFLAYALVMVFLFLPFEIFNLEFSTIFLALPFFVVVISTSKHWAWLEAKPLQVLGHISYGIYLYHGLVLYWFFKTINDYMPIPNLTPWQFWPGVAVCAMLTLMISFYSYKYIELKFISK